MTTKASLGRRETRQTNLITRRVHAFDGAEVCELVGLFKLYELEKQLVNSVGFYKDNGLAVMRSYMTSYMTSYMRSYMRSYSGSAGFYKYNGLAVMRSYSGSKADRIRKDLKDLPSVRAVNVLDITLNMDTGSYQPYRKANDP